MLKLAVIGSLAAALLSPALVDDPPPPPPADRVIIDVVTVNGSGCPAGSAMVQVSPDNTDFVVYYGNYIAMVGVGAVPTDARKNCQLSLVIHVPQGMAYAVTEYEHFGFASLVAGTTALFRSNFYFQGQTPPPFRVHNFTGPIQDDWETVDTTDIASVVYSPCGALRNFNINTELRVNVGTSDPKKTSSYMWVDTSRHFRLSIRPCTTT